MYTGIFQNLKLNLRFPNASVPEHFREEISGSALIGVLSRGEEFEGCQPEEHQGQRAKSKGQSNPGLPLSELRDRVKQLLLDSMCTWVKSSSICIQ